MTTARQRLREAVLAQTPTAAALGAFRRRQVLDEYRRRRDLYASQAAEAGLTYDERDAAGRVAGRLAARGYTPIPRALGEVHTFAFVSGDGWHPALLPDLRELGPLTTYDYCEQGYQRVDLLRPGAAGEEALHSMHGSALAALEAAHKERPVDWIFMYANGRELDANFLRRIVERIGVPVVSMCLDDKQSWIGSTVNGRRTGQIDIAPHFDLAWTSARVACEWYLVEGGIPLYLPEGFDVSTFGPLEVTRDIPVSFVGARYGFRPEVIRNLRRRGLPVETFGQGWENAAPGNEQVRVFNRSQINLGMGGIGYVEELTNVKGRDFDIPGTGGGLYLTSYNADLAQHFAVGEEIVCYRGEDELVELSRHYLRHPDEATVIAERGRVRCLAEHRWLHRYQRVLETLGVLGPSTPKSRP